jgi:hypothetical protein
MELISLPGSIREMEANSASSLPCPGLKGGTRELEPEFPNSIWTYREGGALVRACRTSRTVGKAMEVSVGSGWALRSKRGSQYHDGCGRMGTFELDDRAS